MRLSPRAVSLLCLVAVALPLGAGAATAALKLRDVVAIVQANKKPLAFDMTAKGTYGKASATITVDGVQNGDMKTLAKAAAEARIVLDAKDGADSWGHAVFRAKMAKETLYVRLETFSAKGEWAALINEAKPYMNEWYSFPIDPDEYEAYLKSNANNRNASYKEIEAFLTIVTQELRDGKTQHTITVPRAKQRRLLTRLLGRGYARTYGSPSVDIRFTVETAKNVFSAMNGSATVKATMDGVKGSVTLSAKTSALKTAPAISAPAQSTPWEDFIDNVTSEPLEGARNAQRKSDVNTILNAVYQYAIDNDGDLPPTLAGAKGAEKMICTTTHDCDGISLDTLTGAYLVRLPVDPNLDYLESPETGYVIQELSNGRLTVSAPLAENGVSISVTR